MVDEEAEGAPAQNPAAHFSGNLWTLSDQSSMLVNNYELMWTNLEGAVKRQSIRLSLFDAVS